MSKVQWILGWLACALSTSLGAFWAFWGVLENFHEGWYSTSVWLNLRLMLFQYLSPALIFVVLAMVSLRWPWVGAALHIGTAAVLAVFFFNRLDGVPLILCASLAALGLLYLFGRPSPLKLAYGLAVGLPVIVALGFATQPVIRMSTRHSGSNPSAVEVATSKGNKLVWAPRGPGWPEQGVTWDEAAQRCRHLTEDGLTLAAEPQNIWRLPTIEEAVQSLTRHNVNAGGSWSNGAARYTSQPDKEPPVWDSYSPVIYYWTQSEVAPDRARIICFNGHTPTHGKRFTSPTRSFRAVKDVR